MKTRHGFEAASIAHKIEIENNGDSLDMMTAIGSMSDDAERRPICKQTRLVAEEDQDWANETSTYTFNDGSKLVFNGPDVQRIEPTEEN